MFVDHSDEMNRGSVLQMDLTSGQSQSLRENQLSI